jgi:hypothetical protein
MINLALGDLEKSQTEKVFVISDFSRTNPQFCSDSPMFACF